MAECVSVIVVFWQVFPLWSLEKRQPTVLVVCGPDQNGCVGLACARHLRVFVSNRTTRFSLICDHCDWRMCVCVTGIHPHRLHPQTLLRQSSSGPDGSVWADGPAVPVLPAHWGEIRRQPNSEIKRASRGNLRHLQKPRAATRIQKKLKFKVEKIIAPQILPEIFSLSLKFFSLQQTCFSLQKNKKHSVLKNLFLLKA